MGRRRDGKESGIKKPAPRELSREQGCYSGVTPMSFRSEFGPIFIKIRASFPICIPISNTEHAFLALGLGQHGSSFIGGCAHEIWGIWSIIA